MYRQTHLNLQLSLIELGWLDIRYSTACISFFSYQDISSFCNNCQIVTWKRTLPWQPDGHTDRHDAIRAKTLSLFIILINSHPHPACAIWNIVIIDRMIAGMDMMKTTSNLFKGNYESIRSLSSHNSLIPEGINLSHHPQTPCMDLTTVWSGTVQGGFEGRTLNQYSIN